MNLCRRHHCLLILFAVLLMLLGGCGGTPHPEAASDHGKIVIDFWNGFTGPDGKTMTRMVDQFQAENPDVEVRMQFIP